jgi:hypothetical protein
VYTFKDSPELALSFATVLIVKTVITVINSSSDISEDGCDTLSDKGYNFFGKGCEY